MNNRIAFIDFVRGLLTINPLERWSPHQAKLHPFITQQKFTGPFVPPMNLKSTALNRSPAPGTQQQQQAEAISKQRAQAAQAQATSAAQGAYSAMAVAGQYQQPSHSSAQPPLYGNNNMYSPNPGHSSHSSHTGHSGHTGAPPSYGSQSSGYGQMGMSQAQAQSQAQVQMPPANYAGAGMSQPNVYAQQSARRPRASTMEQQQSGIPAAIQRVASHLDPSQPIRLQPSPAYYPPPPDGMAGMDQTPNRAGRRGSRAQQPGRGNNRDFIRNLEERTLEEGFMGNNQSPWQ
jgi:dual specificity protein kinase YAK1